jgi:NADH-quinone oxidoreductase subunit M
MLLGILYVYFIAGTLNIEYLFCFPFGEVEQTALWLFFFVSFASKIPMFPFHI